MLIVTDTAKKVIKRNESKLNLERIIIKTDSPIRLHLAEWEKAGLRITISVDDFGFSYFNDIPYKSEEDALLAYNCLLKNIEQGNYSLEISGNNKIKLYLNFGEFE